MKHVGPLTFAFVYEVIWNELKCLMSSFIFCQKPNLVYNRYFNVLIWHRDKTEATVSYSIDKVFCGKSIAGHVKLTTFIDLTNEYFDEIQHIYHSICQKENGIVIMHPKSSISDNIKYLKFFTTVYVNLIFFFLG